MIRALLILAGFLCVWSSVRAIQTVDAIAEARSAQIDRAAS